MPNLLKKRCAFRGCPNRTRSRYCDKHLPLSRQVYDLMNSRQLLDRGA